MTKYHAVRTALVRAVPPRVLRRTVTLEGHAAPACRQILLFGRMAGNLRKSSWSDGGGRIQPKSSSVECRSQGYLVSYLSCLVAPGADRGERLHTGGRRLVVSSFELSRSEASLRAHRAHPNRPRG